MFAGLGQEFLQKKRPLDAQELVTGSSGNARNATGLRGSGAPGGFRARTTRASRPWDIPLVPTASQWHLGTTWALNMVTT